jgi:integrase
VPAPELQFVVSKTSGASPASQTSLDCEPLVDADLGTSTVPAATPRNPQIKEIQDPQIKEIQAVSSSVATYDEPKPVRVSLRSDTVVTTTDSAAPLREELEKMARRRYQNPKPFQEGAFWWILCWQDEFVSGVRIRKRKRIKLAPATMPVREAKKVAAEHINPLNQGLVTLGSATNFQLYVDQTYKVVNLPLLAASTRERYSGVIKNYLIPAFGPSCLRELTPLTVQKYFSGLSGSTLSHESIDKIRDVLSSILVSAKHYGLLVANPVEGVRLPPSKRGSRNKPYVTPQMFQLLSELIPEPYATMVYVAVFTGLRVSEVIGLRWRNVHADSITVDERYCRGDWGCPKSEASNATIAVNETVIKRIHSLKGLKVRVRAGRAVREFDVVKSANPEDLVFQSLMSGSPMRDNNILVRFIKPAGRKLGIGFVNWRCLRTSHATWLKMAGADVKDAQAQMRHSRASTTLDIYQQFVPSSQRRAIDKLDSLGVSTMVI